MAEPSHTETHFTMGKPNHDSGTRLFYGILAAFALFLGLRLAFAFADIDGGTQLAIGLTMVIVGGVLMWRRRQQKRQMESATRAQAELHQLKDKQIALQAETARVNGDFDRFGDRN